MTHTGKKFKPFNPQIEDIDIEDIAHALSNICRFNGHVNQFYSVAEHSILVSVLCPDELKLKGLLHDAAEAYLGDVPSPIKLQRHVWAEEFLLDKIFEKFKVASGGGNGIIHQIDEQVLFWEALKLGMDPFSWDWIPDGRMDKGDCFPELIQCLEPKKAKNLFLSHFRSLT